MEIIPELNIISEFEAGMNCLQNPSLFSRCFSFSSSGKVHSFWKWSALFLVVATFTGVITRIKLLFLRICRDKLLAYSGPPTQQLDDDYDSGEDEATSSEDEDDEPTTPLEDRQPFDEDFCVAGSSLHSSENVGSRDLRLRRQRSGGGDRFSWSDFANGKSVVKLWDSLGLGLDFEEDSCRPGSIVSHWQSKDRKVISSSGPRFQNLAMSITSPEVILSAGSNNENILLGVYDMRVSSLIPANYAEWRRQRGKVVGINSGGVEKVYVRDDITGALTVGDMRKIRTPLENPTEYDRDTWWDADAVIFSDDSH